MIKPIGWNCQECAQDPQYLGGTVWVKDCTNPALLANAASVTCNCGTKCIPVFAICDPPEPTVIDESDLAPGMVVVAVDDHDGCLYREWLCTPDAHLALGRYHQLVWARRQDPHWHRDGVIIDRYVRRIAGSRRP